MPRSTDPITILGIAKVEGGYRIYDQNEQEHLVHDEASLGHLIASICADPNAPKAQAVRPTAAKLRDVAVRIASRMMPGYEELSEPTVDVLTAFGRFLHKKYTEPAPPKVRGPRPVRRARQTPGA